MGASHFPHNQSLPILLWAEQTLHERVLVFEAAKGRHALKDIRVEVCVALNQVSLPRRGGASHKRLHARLH